MQFGNRSILCVEWDKRHLRVLAARVGGGRVRLVDAHSFRMPAGLDVDDSAALGRFIADSLRSKGMRGRRVVVDVARDRAVINRLALPPTPMHDLAAAVRFQAMKELPFALDEAALDFVVLEKAPRNLATQVLLAAVRNETLDRLRSACTAAGLELVRVGLRSYGNLQGLHFQGDSSERRVLIADVGPSTTEISICRGGVLAFSRSASVSVPFAGGELVHEDSRVVSRVELGGTGGLEGQVESEAVNALLTEIGRTLQAYRASETSAVVDQIIIAGGTGIEAALVPAVEKRFSMPVALYDPTVALGVGTHEAVKLRAFSALLGLAHGLSREGRLEIDFLNPKRPEPRGKSLRYKLRVGALAAGILVAAAGGWLIREHWTLNRRIAELDALVSKPDGTITRQVRDMLSLEIGAGEVEEWRSETRSMVWLDHLLRIAQSREQDFGKKLLVTGAECNAASSVIRLKVSAANFAVVDELAKELNAVRVGGKPIYDARVGRWQDNPASEAKFKGDAPVEVRLLNLADAETKLKQREKEQKKLLDI